MLPMTRAGRWLAVPFIVLITLLASCDREKSDAERRSTEDATRDAALATSAHAAIDGTTDTDEPAKVAATEQSESVSDGKRTTSANLLEVDRIELPQSPSAPVNAPAGDKLKLGSTLPATTTVTTPPASQSKTTVANGTASRRSVHIGATKREAGQGAVVGKPAQHGLFGQTGEESQPLERSRVAADSTTRVDEGNTEEYDRIYENEFLASTTNPLSTFSIDVDRASYSNARRYIQQGALPPRDAVRLEELVNYFHYSYDQPKDGKPFTIATEVATCPWAPEHKLVAIGLQGRTIPMGDIPPSNLVFLIDVSGSMDEPNKLPLLKESFRLLVNELRDRDRVSIVVYAGNAGLVLPPTRGSEKETILAALDRLNAGGSTAGGAGIQLAYSTAMDNFIANGNNRVILATDGDFNVGVSSDGELVRMIEEKRRSGVFLTVLGFGSGNYKDSKMEQLADKGNGNYAYIDNLAEGRKVFVKELGATLFTIAKDVKIQIEFNPAHVKAYRLIGYENRMLKTEDFHDDRKDAGELGAGHSVTALYEIVPAGGAIDLPWVDPLKYTQPSGLFTQGAASAELLTVKLRFKPPKDSVSQLLTMPVTDAGHTITSASENLRFAAAVAQWGLLLRDSRFKGTSSIDDVLTLASGALGTDAEGYRAEFVDLAKRTKVMLPSAKLGASE